MLIYCKLTVINGLNHNKIHIFSLFPFDIPEVIYICRSRRSSMRNIDHFSNLGKTEHAYIYFYYENPFPLPLKKLLYSPFLL